ncbi:MAG TPA: VOC family protein [Acidimicrobiales bacterium]|jgi:catechol 2,3-dioxygenase-like lactoylglutathione lyase family enzyme|nr:VOC family protein [Acidimicrobiales bacterium]
MGSDPTLNLVVLRCHDLARSRRFYDALGLRFVDERHGERPPHLAATLAGGTVVELYPAAETGTAVPAQVARDPRLGFAVEHIDAVVAEVEVLGAQVIVRPAEGADGEDQLRRAIVVDPDGRRVELLAREHSGAQQGRSRDLPC